MDKFLQILFSSLSVAPYVVAGIESIHSTASTETKTQIALQSLGLATQTATAVLPEDQAAMATAVSSEATNIITSIQNIVKAIKPAAAAPAPTPTTTGA